MPNLHFLRPVISGFVFGTALGFSRLPWALSLLSTTALNQHDIRNSIQRGDDEEQQNVLSWIVLHYITTLVLVTSLVSTVVIYIANHLVFSHAGVKSLLLAPRKSSDYGWFPYDGNVLGGLLQGVGMGIVKSEPGLVLLSFGAQIRLRGLRSDYAAGEGGRLEGVAGWVVVGGLLGGLLYVLGNESFKKGARFVPNKIDEARNKSVKGGTGRPSSMSLQEIIAVRPGLFIIGYSALLVLGIWALGTTTGDAGLSKDFDTKATKLILKEKSLAIFGGLGIGLSQLISILLTKGTLGVSSIYPASATHFLRLLGSNRPNPGYSSLLFGLGVIFSGKLFASRFPELLLNQDSQHSPVSAVVGGLLMIFGARVAGGCTSGHGIFGCGLLSVSSFVTIITMIIGVLSWAFLFGI